MTQMINFVIALTQIVVKIDVKNDTGRLLGKVLRFLSMS
jgi:hypothetical protein